MRSPRKDLDRLEAAAARRALAALRDARERVTSILSDGYRPRGTSPADYDEAFARAKKAALDAEIARFQATLTRDVDEMVRTAAKSAGSFMRSASGFPVVVDGRVVEFASATAAEEVRAVSAATRSVIRKTITRAVAGGLSHSEMVADIREALGGEASRARVERIARTEVNRSYQQQRAAMDEQLDAADVDLIKRWETQLDDKVRDSHLEIHGQERELGDLFNVGRGATEATPPGRAGYRANGPLDPSLPPEESINCRCDVLYVDREEAVQPYIRKRKAKPKPSRIERSVRVVASARRILPAPPPDRLGGGSKTRS